MYTQQIQARKNRSRRSSSASNVTAGVNENAPIELFNSVAMRFVAGLRSHITHYWLMDGLRFQDIPNTSCTSSHG